MKNKTVLLEVNGMAGINERADDAIRLITTGKLSGENDSWKLTYTETDPDTKHRQHVTMTMDKGVVTLQRGGPLGNSMIFEKERRFEGSYQTPFGSLGLGLYPTQVHYRVSEQGEGEIKLRYHLDLEGHSTGLHQVNIRFKSSPT
jgi:uncharacterized beta-barrel protein YwiB (DUF1934 family)